MIIYETENFLVHVPKEPHVSREEGGHLYIAAKKENCISRLDFTPQEAKEFIRLSMLLGEAMMRGMAKMGVSIERINYQENGNWAFLNNEEPFFHMHLYGRTKDAKHQKFGEALYFPHPTSIYYETNLPLRSNDILEIQNELKLLENTEKYHIDSWK